VDEQREKDLIFALTKIGERINWIADQEALAVWVHGVLASGALDEEKTRLIIRTDEILAELVKGGDRKNAGGS
jgi:hypothetical protein